MEEEDLVGTIGLPYGIYEGGPFYDSPHPLLFSAPERFEMAVGIVDMENRETLRALILLPGRTGGEGEAGEGGAGEQYLDEFILHDYDFSILILPSVAYSIGFPALPRDST